MWLYQGLLTVVHRVRMKWEEIHGWNVTPLTAHSALCSSLGGDVAVILWWGMCCPVCSPNEPPPWVSLLSASQGQSPPLHWYLTGGQAPLGAAQEPALASGASSEMPQSRTGSPPLLPFISHSSLFVPLCCNFFNCWTCCWTLGYHNSVFFKCKNSQSCLFGDGVFNNAIFLHKSAFCHMMNFTCVSAGATASPAKLL